jgi:F0F1-type ATP synthase membrane subunit c/vacuolar-type H+-ATPase subunit K
MGDVGIANLPPFEALHLNTQTYLNYLDQKDARYSKENVEFYIFIGTLVLFLQVPLTTISLSLNLALVTVTVIMLGSATVDYFVLQPHLHEQRNVTFYMFIAMMISLILISFIVAILELHNCIRMRTDKKK